MPHPAPPLANAFPAAPGCLATHLKLPPRAGVHSWPAAVLLAASPLAKQQAPQPGEGLLLLLLVRCHAAAGRLASLLLLRFACAVGPRRCRGHLVQMQHACWEDREGARPETCTAQDQQARQISRLGTGARQKRARQPQLCPARTAATMCSSRDSGTHTRTPLLAQHPPGTISSCSSSANRRNSSKAWPTSCTRAAALAGPPGTAAAAGAPPSLQAGRRRVHGLACFQGQCIGYRQLDGGIVQVSSSPEPGLGPS